jgi:hypothetical protein
MEDFDKVHGIQYLSGGEDDEEGTTCFVQGRPEYCVGRLPCGHHFHPVAVLCHMVVNGMSCPMCR